VTTPSVEVGTTLPLLTARITRATLVRYAGASGDLNPIHYSDHAAAALGLPGVIAHGMLTMGIAVRAVTDWLGRDLHLVSYGVRFTKPVVVPDDGIGAELRVLATVTALSDDSASFTLDVTCAGEKVLGAAKVVVGNGPA
jgi:acyl dehydratase